MIYQWMSALPQTQSDLIELWKWQDWWRVAGYSSKEFVLTATYKDAINQTLIEQWLEKLSWRYMYIERTPIEFISRLMYTNAPMLWLDKQWTIDTIISTLGSLNNKLFELWAITRQQIHQTVSFSDITEADVKEVVILLHREYMFLKDKKEDIFHINQIQWLTMKHVISLKMILYELRGYKDGKLIDTNFTTRYLWGLKKWWGTPKFVKHLSRLDKFSQNLQFHVLVPDGWDIEIKAKRLLQACKLCKFYLDQKNLRYQ